MDSSTIIGYITEQQNTMTGHDDSYVTKKTPSSYANRRRFLNLSPYSSGDSLFSEILRER